MKTAEQNFLLLQEIEANRRFLLMAYQQNPKLLENAEARIKQLFEKPALQYQSGKGYDNLAKVRTD
ncbi:MAG: hypothetical protein HOO95_07220 [Gallionella sp.]|nr:hypothetical protein [Gallionella sp.]